VSRQSGERSVVVPLPAAKVKENGALSFVVTKGEVGSIDLDAPPARGHRPDFDPKVAFAKNVVFEFDSVRPARA
jgi:hypothetical protein